MSSPRPDQPIVRSQWTINPVIHAVTALTATAVIIPTQLACLMIAAPKVIFVFLKVGAQSAAATVMETIVTQDLLKPMRRMQ